MAELKHVYDGTYSVEDFLTLNEILAVKYENQLRANKAAEE